MKQKKGTMPFPSSFTMTQDITSIQAIENLVSGLLAETEDVFLVSVRVNPTNNIKVFLDADSGLSIDKCVKINRAMYRTIEENGWYPDGNFSLEVSSPGIEEPLKIFRQYKKNIGRTVEVIRNDDTKVEGKLINATDESIQLEYTEGKNKKAVTLVKEIPFDQVKQTTVLIAF
ncbi:MAG: ribosome assembly cofactor RimP [Ferruginibacter sp.]